MTANQVFLSCVAILFMGSLTLQVACIRWGLRWTKLAEISWLRATGVLLSVVVVQFLCGGLFAIVLGESFHKLHGIGEYALVLGLQYAVATVVLKLGFSTTVRRAAAATLPLGVLSFAFPCILIFMVRPVLYETYVIPTNAMAPTLLGEHLEAACPRCGAAAYGTMPSPGVPKYEKGVLMVCSREYKSVLVKNAPLVPIEGDRITVCKRLTPKRWDLIVFQYPADPSIAYVKRLVGLPGEEFEIRNGSIWINGERIEPPWNIRGIEYSPNIKFHDQVRAGPGSKPVVLGSDEYFVIGDFVDQSSDSRFWDKGAPGYPPYAVPSSHIVGVVINRYWPLSRWSELR